MFQVTGHNANAASFPKMYRIDELIYLKKQENLSQSIQKRFMWKIQNPPKFEIDDFQQSVTKCSAVQRKCVKSETSVSNWI